MDIVCQHCGSTNNYRTELKSGHLVAHCNSCQKFIKNIPHQEPKMYFGKYKGRLIKDIPDLGYLEWVISKNLAKGNIKQAIIKQIENIKLIGL